jgi:hypothetical protein
MVPKVIDFNERVARSRMPAMRRPEDSPDMVNLVARFRHLQSRARTEIHDAILLLDLAVQHTHRLMLTIGDTAVRKALEDDLHVIEELLQLARNNTAQL